MSVFSDQHGGVHRSLRTRQEPASTPVMTSRMTVSVGMDRRACTRGHHEVRADARATTRYVADGHPGLSLRLWLLADDHGAVTRLGRLLDLDDGEPAGAAGCLGLDLVAGAGAHQG